MLSRMLSRGLAEGRADDTNLEAAKRRVAVFHEMGNPTLERLRKDGVAVHTVDGTQSVEGVWRSVMQLGTPLTRRVEVFRGQDQAAQASAEMAACA